MVARAVRRSTRVFQDHDLRAESHLESLITGGTAVQLSVELSVQRWCTDTCTVFSLPRPPSLKIRFSVPMQTTRPPRSKDKVMVAGSLHRTSGVVRWAGTGSCWRTQTGGIRGDIRSPGDSRERCGEWCSAVQARPGVDGFDLVGEGVGDVGEDREGAGERAQGNTFKGGA